MENDRQRLALFSRGHPFHNAPDFVLPDQSVRSHPESVFRPNGSTLDVIDELVNIFLSLAHHQAGSPVFEELLHLIGANHGSDHSVARMRTLPIRFRLIGEAFIGTDEVIQQRANNYVFTHIARAETTYREAVGNLAVEGYAFNNVEVAETLAHLFNQPFVGVPQPTLPGDYFDRPENIFSLSQRSLNAILGMFVVPFQRSEEGHLLRKRVLNEPELHALDEVFLYFDVDNDDIISRWDMVEGFTCLGENFIRSDDFSQQRANEYVQGLIRTIIDQIQLAVSDLPPPPPPPPPPHITTKASATCGGGSATASATARNPLDAGERNPIDAVIEALTEAIGPLDRFRNAHFLPEPILRESYFLVFNHIRYWFRRRDFGGSFEPFLNRILQNGTITADTAQAANVYETHRDFFTHLGVGVEVHPFALQHEFRQAIERRMERDVPLQFQDPILSLVDCNVSVNPDVLEIVWPLSLQGYRIMVLKFGDVPDDDCVYPLDRVTVYTRTYDSADGGNVWGGKNVILLNCNGSFTLLEPDFYTNTPWESPIDDIVAAIVEFNTPRPPHEQVMVSLRDVDAYLW